MDAAVTREGRYNVGRYLQLSDCGILAPDDRVELLDGLVVAMAPPSPAHDYAVQRVQYALLRRLGLGVVTRVQSSLIAGAASVPQPDVVVLPGEAERFRERIPSTALLVVEIALSSLAQDRLTKAAIYAGAGIPCYWIVNLRDVCVEEYRAPVPEEARYASVRRAGGDDLLRIDAFPDVAFEAREMLPPEPGTRGPRPA